HARDQHRHDGHARRIVERPMRGPAFLFFGEIQMNPKTPFRIIALSAAFFLLGCTDKLASTPNAEGNTGVFKVASGHDASVFEYIVDPPDEITIKAPNIKEIDGSKQVVRADGKISLNLL